MTIYTANLQESQKYMMDTKHIIAVGPTVMNEQAYQALTEEEQGWIDQAAYETWEKFTQYSIDSENDYIQKLIDAAELGFEEEQTQALICAKLEELGVAYQTQRTWVVGLIQGDQPRLRLGLLLVAGLRLFGLGLGLSQGRCFVLFLALFDFFLEILDALAQGLAQSAV